MLYNPDYSKVIPLFHPVNIICSNRLWRIIQWYIYSVYLYKPLLICSIIHSTLFIIFTNSMYYYSFLKIKCIIFFKNNTNIFRFPILDSINKSMPILINFREGSFFWFPIIVFFFFFSRTQYIPNLKAFYLAESVLYEVAAT